MIPRIIQYFGLEYLIIKNKKGSSIQPIFLCSSPIHLWVFCYSKRETILCSSWETCKSTYCQKRDLSHIEIFRLFFSSPTICQIPNVLFSVQLVDRNGKKRKECIKAVFEWSVFWVKMRTSLLGKGFLISNNWDNLNPLFEFTPEY